MISAYFDCYSGISGDMILGALIDLGLKENYIKKELKKIKISRYELKIDKIKKNNITGTNLTVKIKEKQKKRGFKEIQKLIDESNLEKDVKKISKQIFLKLATAESKIHNISIEKIHFHEVGAIDSIIDIIGAVIGFKKMQLSNIYCSHLPLGRGFIECSHGKIPVPAPATLEILKNIPVYSTDIQHELVTPTGAAIITTFAKHFGPMPLMKINKIGYGAGKTNMEHPNFLRIILGEVPNNYNYDTTTIIETNIDDMNPEIYGYLVEKLYENGALDVFFTHIQMKKNRPGVKLSVISSVENVNNLADIIFSETSTFGIRFYETKRIKLMFEKQKIKTKYGEINVKIGRLKNRIITISPEFEDCRNIADRYNLPLKNVYELAKRKIKK